MGFIKKAVNWIRLNLASVLGVLQGIVKVVKELATAIVNILFPLIPNANFHAVVLKVREILNNIDDWIEKIKVWLIPVL